MKRKIRKTKTVKTMVLLIPIVGLTAALLLGQGNQGGQDGAQEAPPAEARENGAPPEKAGGPPLPPAPVVTATVQEGTFAQPIRLTGNVEPEEMTLLSSEVGGIVQEVFVEEGDRVTSGTPLVRMRLLPLELDLKRIMASAREEREKLRELRAGSRPEEIAITKANWEEARTAAEVAKAEYERYAELLRDKSVSKSEYDVRRQAWDAARAREEVAKANYDLALEGPRDEVIAAQEAVAASTQADADLASDRLTRATIRAPYDGVIIERMVSPGSYLSVGSPVLSIEHQDVVEVQIQVPETSFRRVSLGDEFNIVFDAYPRESFQGKVAEIIPRADRRSRSFPIKIKIDNQDGRLATGMLARVSMDPPSSGETSVVVPKDAIVPDLRGAIVYRVDFRDGEPFATPVPVETGRFFGQAVEVFGDLRDGQLVVTHGNERLQPGQPLRLNTFVTNQAIADSLDKSRFFKEDFSQLQQTSDQEDTPNND